MRESGQPRDRFLVGPRITRRAFAAAVAAVAALALVAVPASARVEVFRNADPIAIPGVATSGPASPYPSTVAVSGMSGPVTDVNVTLHRVSHATPRQLRMLLVAPGGRKVSLMDRRCGGEGFDNRTWIFDQQAALEMPVAGPCPEILYRPSGYAPNLPWPFPAPYLFADVSLDRLERLDANGTWQLWVADDGTGATGRIADGWSLTVTTYDGPVDMLVPGAGETGPASPYPATRTVSGQAGVIADVDVSIAGLWHQEPDDLDMLLVGPAGQSVVLASDACGPHDLDAVTWTLDDEAPAALPDETACTGGRYRPADYPFDEVWPAGTPPGPHATSLSAFDGSEPDGDWRLYVQDDLPSDVGFVTDRFALSIVTRPRATVAFAQGAAEPAEGASARLVVRRTGPAALGAASVKVTTAALGATAGADFAPVPTTLAFAPGEREEHVDLAALADREAEPDETFAVTLSDASGDAAVAAPATAAVTIRDVPARTSAPGTTPGGRRPDRTPPRISDVGLAPATFAVARRSTARAAARRGTTIRYTLSEPAAVVLRFQRAVGRGRHVTVGTLRRSARQGRNRVGFSGRIGRRTLRPGAHRLTVSAVDAAGNRSAARPRRFRIVRQP